MKKLTKFLLIAGLVGASNLAFSQAFPLGPNASATGDNATAIGPNASATAADATAVGVNAEANGEFSTALGSNALADAPNSVAIGSEAYSVGDNSVAIGYAANATGENSVAIGSNSYDDGRTNVVSFGNDTTNRQLIRVADGVADNDAVNMRQLNKVAVKADVLDTKTQNMSATPGQTNFNGNADVSGQLKASTIDAQSGTVEQGAISPDGTVSEKAIANGSDLVKVQENASADATAKANQAKADAIDTSKQYTDVQVGGVRNDLTTAVARQATVNQYFESRLDSQQSQINRNTADISNLQRKTDDMKREYSRGIAATAAMASSNNGTFQGDGVYSRAGVGMYQGYTAVSAGLVGVKGADSLGVNIAVTPGSGSPVFGVGYSRKLF